MTDVVVVESGDESSDESVEAVADAIDTAIEVEQSFEIGVIAGEVNAMKDQVQLHDGLIQLHSHDGFVTMADLQECEERICAKIDSIAPPMEEALTEPIEETTTEPETSDSESESESSDEPPRSRRNRGSIAERYYKSSKL